MDMWLDKIKSAMLASFTGCMTCAVTAGLALQLVAKQHGVTNVRAAQFAYANPVGTWPRDLAIYGLFSVVIGAAVALGLWFVVANHRWTIRPKNLRSDESAQELLALSTLKGKPRIFAGRFNDKPFYSSLEDRAVVIGPPGTGKTAFLLNQLLRAATDRMSFVCIDFKPEIHAIVGKALEARGYQIMLIDPVSGASPDHWNPLAEIAGDDEIAITELTAALLPIRAASEAPFLEAQRDWLLGALLHMKNLEPAASLPMVYDLLKRPASAIVDVLVRSGSAPAQAIGNMLATGLAGNDKLVLQGYTGASRALKFLGYASIKDALSYSDFDMRELGKTPRPVAVFLKFAETKADTMGPILSLLATRIFATLIDTAGTREPVALFFDELGVLTPIPNLAKRLNTIRSRHMPTWMYFQAVEQLEDQYGKGAASKFFAAASIKMCFRLDDIETRKQFSTLVGTTHQIKVSQSKNGANGSTTRSREKIDTIEPHQLGEFKPGEILVLSRGASAIGKGTPHYRDFPEFLRK